VDFKGTQPTQTAAVVVATTKMGARKLLGDALQAKGLRLEKDAEMAELKLDVAGAYVLSDGEY